MKFKNKVFYIILTSILLLNSFFSIYGNQGENKDKTNILNKINELKQKKEQYSKDNEDKHIIEIIGKEIYDLEMEIDVYDYAEELKINLNTVRFVIEEYERDKDLINSNEDISIEIKDKIDKRHKELLKLQEKYDKVLDNSNRDFVKKTVDNFNKDFEKIIQQYGN